MAGKLRPDSGNHTPRDFAEFLKYAISPHLAGDEQIRQTVSQTGDQILSIDYGGKVFVVIVMTEAEFVERRTARRIPKIQREHPVRDPFKNDR